MDLIESRKGIGTSGRTGTGGPGGVGFFCWGRGGLSGEGLLDLCLGEKEGKMLKPRGVTGWRSRRFKILIVSCLLVVFLVGTFFILDRVRHLGAEQLTPEQKEYLAYVAQYSPDERAQLNHRVVRLARLARLGRQTWEDLEVQSGQSRVQLHVQLGQKGSVGYLSGQCEILQVVGPTSCIVVRPPPGNVRPGVHFSTKTIWIDGVSMANHADGEVIEGPGPSFLEAVFAYAGTKTYETAQGALSTVHRLRALDPGQLDWATRYLEDHGLPPELANE